MIIKIKENQVFLNNKDIKILFKRHNLIKNKIWEIGWEELKNINIKRRYNLIQKIVFKI